MNADKTETIWFESRASIWKANCQWKFVSAKV